MNAYLPQSFLIFYHNFGSFFNRFRQDKTRRSRQIRTVFYPLFRCIFAVKVVYRYFLYEIYFLWICNILRKKS